MVTSFLETWRAILFGREALLRGLIYQIGPGDINIWSTSWVGNTQSRHTLTRLENVQMETVSQLFIPGTRRWDEHLVRSSFTVLDADEILKVKRGERLNEDVLAWGMERHGIYSMRSCYRLLKHDQDQ